MDTYKPSNRKRKSARERQMARKRRHESMAVRMTPSEDRDESHKTSRFAASGVLQNVRSYLQDRDWLNTARTQGALIWQDMWWHIKHNPKIIRSVIVIVLVVIALYPLSYLFSGNIFPNVHTLNVNVGGMSVEEAEDVIQTAWTNDFQIELTVFGESVALVRPRQLGLSLDVYETARAARRVGLKALPFGTDVEPVLDVDYLTAQNYLLDLSDQINTRPYNAGYEWQDDQLVGIAGRDGYVLDVSLTLEQLQQHAPEILNRQRLELLVLSIPPDMNDPSPYLDEAHTILDSSLELHGYDPYTNEHFTWPINQDIFASWLAAGASSLTLREDTFLTYLDALNSTLNTDEAPDLRYIAQDEATNMMRDAIAVGQTSISLRVRYHDTEYVVQPGDRMFGIARKTGIPYYLLLDANSNMNPDVISPGDIIHVPTRDVTMPNNPVPNKRIVVDLETQYLVAYEDNQVRFEWPISSGVSSAPTSPGIYQILGHGEVEYGSSNLLCNDAGLQCGQWAMNWFMGIYEVTPGLVNGFHGDVLLPNGRFLGDGLIGTQTTFGCIMSSDAEAKMMYDWADVGTVVEILSDEYQPLSDLGRLTLSRTRGT